MIYLVTVGNTPLKNPSEYSGLTADIVDSGRNVEGYVVSDVIRYDVAKVEMSWKYLTVSEWSGILKLFNPTYGGSFINSVTFFNQCSGSFSTREMYISDRSAGVALMDENVVKGWADCKLSLVEV